MKVRGRSVNVPLLRSAVLQGVTTLLSLPLLVAVLRHIDVDNPKVHAASEWSAAAQWSLVAITVLLMAQVAGTVLLALFGTPVAMATHSERTLTPATCVKPLPLDPSERDRGVAWPTVGLSICALTLHAVFAYLGATARLPLALAVPLCALSIFVSFTPMHDAV